MIDDDVLERLYDHDINRHGLKTTFYITFARIKHKKKQVHKIINARSKVDILDTILGIA